MIEAALLPFQLPFMQNAFWIGAMISVPTALLSCFLVLKGWSLMGDAISHAVLPGVVLAYIAGLVIGFAGILVLVAPELSLDHAGPMAHTAEDVALAMDVLAGHDLVHRNQIRRILEGIGR